MIVLTAFAVVLGTLVIQGLTLKPLMRMLRLQEDDPVSREVAEARRRALAAVRASLPNDGSPETRFVLHAFEARLDGLPEDGAHRAEAEDGHDVLFRRAFDAARRVTFEMRDRDEIGDDAFHRLEEDLDWLEMSAGGTGK